MTDTQAKSGTASAATDEAKQAGEAAMTGSDSGAPDAGTVNGTSTPGETTIGGTPKFQRAPGMAPPPDSLTVPIQSPPSVAKGKAGVVTPPPITLGSSAPAAPS